ncbi:hypothetical protein EXIGLDRAFT_830495 [Exidia glandulosa HHB12029]|uniref:Mid2 domain-containing protein n=1 Tax=Exidia glandulosa HHB12029 TaxID=1314781 RepID=A0A165NK27_EXIGL|nr:hypothetical protein EXIGLDRAFT_830495 [Exidia glandulosa HHB12029]
MAHGMCLNCGHDGTQPTSVTFRFTGTAVYIYCVLANDVPATSVTGTHLWFSIDGEIVDTFHHTPNSSADMFLYNQLLYSNHSIPDGQHVFNMSARTDGPDSLILFDYAQYTTSDASSGSNNTSVSPVPAPAPESTLSSPNHKAKPVAIIVGAVIGSTIAGVLLLAVLLWWFKRRRARGQDAEYSAILEDASQDASNIPPSITPRHALLLPTESQAWTDLQSEGISHWGDEKIHADPSVTTATLGAGSSVEHGSSLLDEVTLLRDEVERLRTYETAFLTPPSYDTLSTAGAETGTSRPNTSSSSDIHV